MSANVESFAGRAPAWHGLGYVFAEDEQSDLATMLDKANLAGWNVRTRPLVTDAVCDKEEVEVIRDSPFVEGQIDRLSTMGGRYEAVQNEDVFELGESLVNGGAQWDTAGSLDGGRVVFGAYRLPRDIILDAAGAADLIRTYLIVATSHNGTMPTMGFNSNVRVVCENTLNMAVKGAPQAFKIRHTASAPDRMKVVGDAFRKAYAYADALEAEAAELYRTPMDLGQFTDLAVTLYPKPEAEKKAAVTKWEKKIDTLGNIFTGPTSANIAGTAWAGLNALTEAQDWYRKARGGDGSGKTIAMGASGFVPSVQTEKNRIRKAVLEFASA